MNDSSNTPEETVEALRLHLAGGQFGAPVLDPLTGVANPLAPPGAPVLAAELDDEQLAAAYHASGEAPGDPIADLLFSEMKQRNLHR